MVFLLWVMLFGVRIRGVVVFVEIDINGLVVIIIDILVMDVVSM